MERTTILDTFTSTMQAVSNASKTLNSNGCLCHKKLQVVFQITYWGGLWWTQTQGIIIFPSVSKDPYFFKVHSYSSLDMATFGRENGGGLKCHDTCILFAYCFNVLVLMTPMRMDDALTLPFLCLQSISRPLSASVSLMMGKVKTSQK